MEDKWQIDSQLLDSPLECDKRREVIGKGPPCILRPHEIEASDDVGIFLLELETFVQVPF